MIPLLGIGQVRRILCLGAHCDDIEIGAGGTLMRLIAEHPGLEIRWVVLCGQDTARAAEARHAASLFGDGAARLQVDLHAYRDAHLPWQGSAVKETFEALRQDFVPDLILTHHGADRHQDHRLVSELTWNTWRDHAILEYEVVKWDGDLGQPNIFVPLDEALCRRKVSQLLDAYATQRPRAWFSEDVFLALLRLRGVECNAPSRYAEAFHARKLLM